MWLFGLCDSFDTTLILGFVSHLISAMQMLRRAQSRMPSIGRAVRILLIVLVVVLMTAVASKVAWDLSLRLWYEFQGLYNGDSAVYWAIGRGILNGFMPYHDLFDMKPLGIFLISALSFFVTGDTRLDFALQAFVIAGFPFVFILFALEWPIRCTRLRLMMFVVFSFVLGSILGLFTAVQSGGFQVESFGAIFGSVYALIIALRGDSMRTRDILFAAACLLCSIGMKEPFLLTNFVACVVLLPNYRTWIRTFFVPLAIAMSAGILFLFFTGWLQSYVGLYLSYIFNNHIWALGSPWIRGLQLQMLFENMGQWTSHLPTLVILLFLNFFWLRVRCASTWFTVLLHIVLAAASVYVVTFAVGLGGHFFNHHFVFAVPAYAALGLLSLRALAERLDESSCGRHRWGSVGDAFLISIIVSTGIVAVQIPKVNYADELSWMVADTTFQRDFGARIDGILDRCGLSRYLFLGGNLSQPYGFTKHSPYGPIFNQFPMFFAPNQVRFRQGFLHSLNASDLIVFNALQVGDLSSQMRTTIDTLFTTTPWPCAGQQLPVLGYTLYYRTAFPRAAISH